MTALREKLSDFSSLGQYATGQEKGKLIKQNSHIT